MGFFMSFFLLVHINPSRTGLPYIQQTLGGGEGGDGRSALPLTKS